MHGSRHASANTPPLSPELLEALPDAYVVFNASADPVGYNEKGRSLLPLVANASVDAPLNLASRTRLTVGDHGTAMDLAFRPVLWDGQPALLCRVRTHADVDENDPVLLDALRRMSEVFDSLGQAIAVLDEHGVIVAVNAQWRITARARGLAEPNDGIGATYLNVCGKAMGIADADLVAVGRSIDDVLEQRALSSAIEYNVGSVERPVHAQLSMQSLHDSRGVLVTHTDITRIRDEQRARVQALAQFEATFENALDAMLLVDDTGTILQANGMAAALLGGNSEPLQGRHLLERVTVAEDGRTTTLDGLLNANSGRGILWVTTTGEHPRDLEYSVRRQVVPGRHLVTLHDVTDLRRLENDLRQAQKMEAVGQLTGGIAHDFNNILTVVIGNAELLLADEREALSANGVDALTDIIATASRGADTVRKLLSFARRNTLAPAPHDIAGLLTDLSRLLHRILPESIRLRMEIADGLPPVRVDASALQQILLNLCTNARDAIGNEGGRVIIRAGIRSGDAAGEAQDGEAELRQHLAIEVEDDGTGMSTEVVAHMFEPFFTTKDVGKGTGLGMAMVYGIMAQHNGRVSIRSAPGRGTTVTLHFPTDAQEPSVANRNSDLRGLAAGVAGGRILLVEDDPAIRRVSIAVLKRAGFHVDVSAHGNQGAARIEQAPTPYDLVISDVVMPNGGGRRIADAVTQHCPGVPVLWITGYAADGVPKRSEHVSAPWRTLQKPWSVDDLLAAVRDTMHAQQHSPPPNVGARS